MEKEQRLDRLIAYLRKESGSYQVLHEPVSVEEKMKLFRSLMNVRFPGKADEDFLLEQNRFLKGELEEKGIVEAKQLKTICEGYSCSQIKNADRIVLWRGDITRLRADAIVNAANSHLLGCFVPCHGCIDNAIHSASGIQLRNACADLMERQGHEERTGQAKITSGYNLPASYVIHTVGPVVGKEVTEKQKEDLRACYRNSLLLSERKRLQSIAFCCIATGEFHFPNKLAAKIAVSEIDRFLSKSNLQRVVINVFKEEDENIYMKLFQ